MADQPTDTATPSPADPLIFRSDLSAILRVQQEALRRWIKSGKLPKPDVFITRRTQAWKASTLKAAGIEVA